MRQMMNPMPMLLLAFCLPVFSAQAEPPSPASGPASTHRIQVFQAGEGEPRVRAAMTARTASPRTQHSVQGLNSVQGSVQGTVQGTVRTRPYQPAKPGEGAPKG